jgi:hypothetical protein
MRHFGPIGRPGVLLLLAIAGLSLAGCGGAGASAPGATASTVPTATASTVPTASASEPGGGTTSGDIPDNAVFLTYHGTAPTFSIPYVQGWQVTPQGHGVVIRDKDSSETVAIVDSQADVAAYVASTDLPALQAQAGFGLITQDTLTVRGSTYIHLAFHLPSPPDAVTGKQVTVTVDRYYVSGPTGLAIVSLATPAGVDNVDAFRQMIEGFKWS